MDSFKTWLENTPTLPGRTLDYRPPARQRQNDSSARNVIQAAGTMIPHRGQDLDQVETLVSRLKYLWPGLYDAKLEQVRNAWLAFRDALTRRNENNDPYWGGARQGGNHPVLYAVASLRDNDIQKGIAAIQQAIQQGGSDVQDLAEPFNAFVRLYQAVVLPLIAQAQRAKEQAPDPLLQAPAFRPEDREPPPPAAKPRQRKGWSWLFPDLDKTKD